MRSMYTVKWSIFNNWYQEKNLPHCCLDACTTAIVLQTLKKTLLKTTNLVRLYSLHKKILRQKTHKLK